MYESTEEFILQKKLRRETRNARNTEAELARVIEGVHGLVEGYFANNRRIKGGDLRGMFEDIDASVRDGMTAVRYRFDERPATRARPKSEAYEAMYVLVNNQESDTETRDRVFRLHAMRIFGSRKKVEIDVRPLPASFSRHSAERLHERGGNVDDSIQALGNHLVEWMLLPVLASDVMSDFNIGRFCVPGPSSGLMMGFIDTTAAVPAGVRYSFNARVAMQESIFPDPLEPYLYSANTYVGEADATAYQMDLRRCFEVWRDAAGDAYRECLDDLVWPVREIRPAVSTGLSDALIAALETLVSDPRALAAMGNHKFARGKIGLNGAPVHAVEEGPRTNADEAKILDDCDEANDLEEERAFAP